MPTWRALPLNNPVGDVELWTLDSVPASKFRTEDLERRAEEHARVQELAAGAPVGYVYRADVYCAGCVLFEVGGDVPPDSLVSGLLRDWARALEINLDDEYSYDSSYFPKPILQSEIKREGVPLRCGRCWCWFGIDPNKVRWCEPHEDFWPNCRCRN